MRRTVINRRSQFLLTLLLGAAGATIGFLAIFLSYRQGWLSWAASAERAPLVLLGIGLLGALGSVLILVMPSLWAKNGISAFLGLWLGISGGVVAPGLVGQTAVWNKAPESVVYSLDVNTLPIRPSVISATQNPLEGERSTLNYMSALPDNSFLMVSSTGTEIFDHLDAPDFSSESLTAVVSLWGPGLELIAQHNLSDVEPSIQLVRGVYFDNSNSDLYVSNLPLNSDCFGLQLWKLDVNLELFEFSNPEMVYTTEPCLESMTGAERFGGRIVADGDGVLYLSVGDFGYGVSTVREEKLDGSYSSRPEILGVPNSIGAIVSLSAEGESSVVSRGHRNPQGLYFDPVTGYLWESEHGPKGGDEVNLIEPGNDYGWPDVTYGGPYGGPPQPSGEWDLGRWYGADHGAFTEPVFSWLPSIAASQILVYQGDAFAGWKGDLLVTSFKGTIHRLRLDDTRVVLDETIAVDVRPRDMVELTDGTLLITTDASEFLSLKPAS